MSSLRSASPLHGFPPCRFSLDRGPRLDRCLRVLLVRVAGALALLALAGVAWARLDAYFGSKLIASVVLLVVGVTVAPIVGGERR